MNHIIQAKQLSRWYGIVMGLNHIDFTIPPGITGLVGPNGAGKSTLIQIITGQLKPSSGTLTVLGQPPYNNPTILQQIGYCPEHETLHTDLNPQHWLTALAHLSGIPPNQAKQRTQTLLQLVKLPQKHWNKPINQYSKGMRQRVKLAQALLHQPQLLILDEPMNGLDPMGRQQFAQILKNLAHQNIHILISSHILAELETLSKNILILNWGRILATGPQKTIRTQMHHWAEQLTIRCQPTQNLLNQLHQQNLLTGYDHDPKNNTLTLRIRDPETFYPQLPQLIQQSNTTLHEIRSQSRTLKNLFDQITQ